MTPAELARSVKPRCRMFRREASFLKVVPGVLAVNVPAYQHYYRMLGFVVGETATHVTVAYYGPVPVDLLLARVALVRRERPVPLHLRGDIR